MNYHMPPPIQCVPTDKLRKYFYVILFIKSYVYNIKGQAIIFKRRSIESLMKLIRDFDQAYLHTSLENSYDKCHMHRYSNVDFIVKYTNDFDEVIELIDQNAYVVKLSWQKNVEIPRPCPPIPPPPHPQPIPPPDIIEQQIFHLYQQLHKVKQEMNEISGLIPISGFGNGVHVRVIGVGEGEDKYKITVQEVDQITNQLIPNTQKIIDVSIYGYNTPDDNPIFNVDDDCYLYDGKILQRIDIPAIPSSINDQIDQMIHDLDNGE